MNYMKYVEKMIVISDDGTLSEITFPNAKVLSLEAEGGFGLTQEMRMMVQIHPGPEGEIAQTKILMKPMTLKQISEAIGYEITIVEDKASIGEKIEIIEMSYSNEKFFIAGEINNKEGQYTFSANGGKIETDFLKLEKRSDTVTAYDGRGKVALVTFESVVHFIEAAFKADLIKIEIVPICIKMTMDEIEEKIGYKVQLIEERDVKG